MARDDRRTRILDAAEQLFADGGFDATATAQIAEVARVPKGLVFYYFPHKIDLLLALLEERMPAPEADLAEKVALRGDPEGSLMGLHKLLRWGTHDSLVLRTIVFRENGTHPEVRRHLRRLRRACISLVEDVLNRALERPADPTLLRQAAETFVAVMLDEANARRAGGTTPDLAGAAHVVARCFA